MPDDTPRRRNRMRHPDFDYAAAGAYFVTLVVQDRRAVLGEVRTDSVALSAQGEMVRDWWARLPTKHTEIELGPFVVMPNHLHGVVALTGAATWGRPYDAGASPTLGGIIRWFKTMTTNAYIRGVRDEGWPPFDGRLWQRNYHDRVIRNAAEYAEIERYVVENPERWLIDDENVGRA